MLFKTRFNALLFIILFYFSSASIVQASCASQGNNEVYALGEMVQKLQVALMPPFDALSLQTIQYYGTDTRYYTMIRGWLSQELQGVESQLGASQDAQDMSRLQKKSDFLQQAIVLIDLE